MKQNIAFVNSFSILLLLVFSLSTASAQITVINYTARGWYDSTGQHSATNLNYAVGDGGRANQHDTRDFFVFDLSGITRPIASANLAMYLAASPDRKGYVSADASENFELHDVVTPIATLVADSAGANGIAINTDLGSGIVYGSRTMTAADMGSIVEISLNPSAITAMNSSHGLFGIGGSLTTLDSLANTAEVVFALSADGDVTELQLTLVPEPTTAALLLLGMLGCGCGRRR